MEHAKHPPRRRRGDETRRKVANTAAELFAARGFGATSMQVIADRAGVHVQTIYLAFGTKAAVLAAAAAALVAGEEDPDSDPGQRAWAVEIQNAPDPETKLRLYARHISDVAGRTIPLFDMMRATAPSEPEVAAFLASAEDGRHRGPLNLFEPIAAAGRLRVGLTLERAADIAYAIASPSTFRAFRERGWSDEETERWVGDSLCALILDDPPRPGTHRRGPGPRNGP